MDPTMADWFAVRCLFATNWPPEARGHTYEERITLWQAKSIEEAIARAEVEAHEYASVIEESPHEYLGLAQACRLVTPPVDGSEVFSLMRDSDLGASEYLAKFFATGRERLGHIEQE